MQPEEGTPKSEAMMSAVEQRRGLTHSEDMGWALNDRDADVLQKEGSRIAPGFWLSKGGVDFPLAETGHGPHGAGGSQCGLLSGGGALERLLALELRDRPRARRREQEPGQAECQLSKPGEWRDPSVPPEAGSGTPLLEQSIPARAPRALCCPCPRSGRGCL